MSDDGLASPITSLPLSLLHAEIARRQANGTERPACGSDASEYSYNTALHVFALFLILALSTLACSFPLIVRRFPGLPVPNYALFLSRHFGTGVLIATAFVHLLPTAYVNLTDPCLPRFWNEVYPAFAGFVAMVSVLLVVGIEMFFASKGAGHSHSLDWEHLGGGALEELRPRRSSGAFRPLRIVPVGTPGSLSIGTPLQETVRSPYSDHPGSRDKPLPAPPVEESGGGGGGGEEVDIAGEDEEEDLELDLDEMDPNSDQTRLLNGDGVKGTREEGNGSLRPDQGSRGVSFAVPPQSPIQHSASPGPNGVNNEQRLVLQCLLLEAGILFHSVFIGMALSVSTGPAFIVLLIAISFHQTFEGLALGSRIASIPSFSTESMKPWFMSLLYGITTPLGQAIGLAVHTLYDPASQFGLLTVGIVNAISAGLLVYAGLVQLLAEDFLSDQSYHELHGRRRLEACGAVVLGAMLMAFVGAFA